MTWYLPDDTSCTPLPDDWHILDFAKRSHPRAAVAALLFFGCSYALLKQAQTQKEMSQ
jgi:hypothetical protein